MTREATTGGKFIAEDYPRLSLNFSARFSCLHFNLDGVMWVRFLFVQMDTRIRNDILTSIEAHSKPMIKLALPCRVDVVKYIICSHHCLSFRETFRSKWNRACSLTCTETADIFDAFKYKFIIIWKHRFTFLTKHK